MRLCSDPEQLTTLQQVSLERRVWQLDLEEVAGET
jgi:hypothetical protein